MVLVCLIITELSIPTVHLSAISRINYRLDPIVLLEWNLAATFLGQLQPFKPFPKRILGMREQSRTTCHMVVGTAAAGESLLLEGVPSTCAVSLATTR